VSTAYIDPADDLIAITPVASAKGRFVTSTNPHGGINPIYRAIYVDTAGNYDIETPGSVGAFRAGIPLQAGMNPIRFISVKAGGAGNAWGVP
jgi:hypothetical protein